MKFLVELAISAIAGGVAGLILWLTPVQAELGGCFIVGGFVAAVALLTVRVFRLL